MDVKVGQKIKVVDTDYYTCVPNGAIMTVTEIIDDTAVSATVDGGDGYPWTMEDDTFVCIDDYQDEIDPYDPAGMAELSACFGIKITVTIGDISITYDGR